MFVSICNYNEIPNVNYPNLPSILFQIALIFLFIGIIYYLYTSIFKIIDNTKIDK